MLSVVTGDPPSPHRMDEPPHVYIYSYVESWGPSVEWQLQFVVAVATVTTKKHELSKHQELSLRINFIQGTNHTNLQHAEGRGGG